LAAALLPALALIACTAAAVSFGLEAHAIAWCIPPFVVGGLSPGIAFASRLTVALIVGGFACCGAALERTPERVLSIPNSVGRSAATCARRSSAECC
jgi:hypothetical protein